MAASREITANIFWNKNPRGEESLTLDHWICDISLQPQITTHHTVLWTCYTKEKDCIVLSVFFFINLSCAASGRDANSEFCCFFLYLSFFFICFFFRQKKFSLKADEPSTGRLCSSAPNTDAGYQTVGPICSHPTGAFLDRSPNYFGKYCSLYYL